MKKHQHNWTFFLIFLYLLSFSAKAYEFQAEIQEGLSLSEYSSTYSQYQHRVNGLGLFFKSKISYSISSLWLEADLIHGSVFSPRKQAQLSSKNWIWFFYSLKSGLELYQSRLLGKLSVFGDISYTYYTISGPSEEVLDPNYYYAFIGLNYRKVFQAFSFGLQASYGLVGDFFVKTSTSLWEKNAYKLRSFIGYQLNDKLHLKLEYEKMYFHYSLSNSDYFKINNNYLSLGLLFFFN